MTSLDRLLAADEELHLITRPHWRRTVGPALTVIVGGPVTAFLAGLVPSGPARELLLLLILGVAVLVLIGFAVRPFLGWLGTSYVVTDRRVILRRGILGRRVRELAMADVGKVSYLQRGLGDRVLRCGVLVCEAAGGRGRLVLRDVPSIRRTYATVYELAEADAKRRPWRRTPQPPW